jgi:hypothetical protein
MSLLPLSEGILDPLPDQRGVSGPPKSKDGVEPSQEKDGSKDNEDEDEDGKGSERVGFPSWNVPSTVG